VHVSIMGEWRNRIAVVSDTWATEHFISDEAWARVEEKMREPRDGQQGLPH